MWFGLKNRRIENKKEELSGSERLFFFRNLLKVICFLIFISSATPVLAVELLTNGNFESPVVTTNGNNLGVVVPGWTANYQTNIVKPYVGYAPSGPNTTPTGGGNQYLDINSNGATATVTQSFTVPQNGIIDYSGWFSIRDSKQAGTATISIINSTGTVVSSANVSFLATDNLGIWRQISVAKLPVTAGTYTFSITLPDVFNVDLTSVIFSPPMAITKSVSMYTDPINGTTNPKAIPNSIVSYTITVTNNTLYPIDSGTVVVSDATPANLALYVGDISGAGSGPVGVTDGTPSSGLTYTYTSLSSTTDSLDFSNNNGTTWNYTPTADAFGTDAAVTNIRVKGGGSMAVGSSFTLTIRYRVK